MSDSICLSQSGSQGWVQLLVLVADALVTQPHLLMAASAARTMAAATTHNTQASVLHVEPLLHPLLGRHKGYASIALARAARWQQQLCRRVVSDMAPRDAECGAQQLLLQDRSAASLTERCLMLGLPGTLRCGVGGSHLAPSARQLGLPVAFLTKCGRLLRHRFCNCWLQDGLSAQSDGRQLTHPVHAELAAPERAVGGCKRHL